MKCQDNVECDFQVLKKKKALKDTGLSVFPPFMLPGTFLSSVV